MPPRLDFAGQPIDLHQARLRARVSDHALLRYMERVLDLPIERFRADMLTDTVVQAMAMNASSVHGHGFKLIIENFTLVTTLPADRPAAIATTRRREIER